MTRREREKLATVLRKLNRLILASDDMLVRGLLQVAQGRLQNIADDVRPKITPILDREKEQLQP
jgi:hypothetical protein